MKGLEIDNNLTMLLVLIVGVLMLIPALTPTLFSVMPTVKNVSFGTLFVFITLLSIVVGIVYFIYEKTRKYEHKRLLFDWMPTHSFIFGLIPYILQNMILFFAVYYGDDLGSSAVYFYLFPLFLMLVLIPYLYLENKNESKIDLLRLLGLQINSGKTLLLSIAIGLALGSLLFLSISHTESIVRTTVMPFSESITAKTVMNQALASTQQRVMFYTVFFLLVGFGEELLCYFGLQVFSNYFYSLGMNKWYSIIAGSLVARVLWAFEHWAAWGSVGLSNMANYVLAITVGLMVFTISGLLLYYKDFKKPRQEYLLITPWMAHFIYDLLVTLSMEGILQSVIMSI